MAPQRPGSHLERHGNKWRVWVRVPPSLWEVIGKKKLMESLPAGTTARGAETLKWPVLARLKGEIKQARNHQSESGLITDALRLRAEADREVPTETTGEHGERILEFVLPDTIETIASDIEKNQGPAAAQTFADIAFGRATPLKAHLQALFDRKRFSPGYEADFERALTALEDWCVRSKIPPTIEAITREIAGRYVHQRFVTGGTHHKTANKDVSVLSSYWRWLRKSVGVRGNPWSEQRLEAPAARHGRRADVKRPFTDDEAAKLLRNIRNQREWEFSIISALSGMREDEIASLTVGNCGGGWFDIQRSKTPAGIRRVPMHPTLSELIAARCSGKASGEFLFHELPEPSGKRGRGAPVAQAFTRERRRVGVDERSVGQRQSNVDFHSWRRWFLRKAIDALHSGATGYDPWTIAHVAGHKAEGGVIDGMTLPLGMTMGHYPGMSPPAALVACVNAVRLPSGTPSVWPHGAPGSQRDGLVPSNSAPHHRRTGKRRRAERH